MTLYHGTTEEAADAIESEGWYGGELATLTDGFTAENRSGVVYLTDSAEEATGYGDVVFEIEMLNESPVFFQESPISDAKEYYINAKTLNNDGIWKRL